MKILFVILIFATKSHAGGAVGNGGGFARCGDQKLYFYDYLVARQLQDFGGDFEASQLEEYLERISYELKRLDKPLSVEFNLYLKSLFKQFPGSPYQWFPQKNLRLMWEPDLYSSLPDSCQDRIQAVYFFPPFLGIAYTSYKFDSDIISQVLRQPSGALQVSYLVTHEWLWNFFERKDFMKLVTLNKLLNSKRLSQMSPPEFSKYKPKKTQQF